MMRLADIFFHSRTKTIERRLINVYFDFDLKEIAIDEPEISCCGLF